MNINRIVALVVVLAISAISILLLSFVTADGYGATCFTLLALLTTAIIAFHGNENGDEEDEDDFDHYQVGDVELFVTRGATVIDVEDGGYNVTGFFDDEDEDESNDESVNESDETDKEKL